MRAALVLGLTLWASSSWATTFYVSTTGSDSNTCVQAQSTATPKQHFVGATGVMTCVVAGNGDVIRARGGTYSEGIRWYEVTIPSGTSWANALTIGSYSGETATLSTGGTIIDLNGAFSYLIFDRLVTDGGVSGFFAGGTAHHIRFQDGEVKNATGQGIQSAGLAGAVHDIEILRTVVHNNGTDRQFDHGLYAAVQNMLIDGCDFYQNAGYGIQIYGPSTDSSTGTVIKHTKIHDNGRFSVVLGRGNVQFTDNLVWGSPNNGVDVDYNATGVVIAFNTIVGSAGAAVATGQNATVTNTQIFNNILYGNGSTINNGAMAVNTTTGSNVTTDPSFSNASANNYSLTAASIVAINQASALYTAADDFAGLTRPQGPASDIGAYEFAGVPQPPPPPTTEPQKYQLRFRGGT